MSHDFQKIHNDSWIRHDQKLKRQPTVLSLGFSNHNKPIPFGSTGNFSCITGKSKVGKSFFKQLLVAGYLGNSHRYVSEIRGTDRGMIVDFDTEQSEYHVQRSVHNIRELTGGIADGKYFAHALRPYDPHVRRDFIEWTLENGRDRIGLVFIDGIADLMRNVNNLDETNELITRMMRWTADFDLHIVTVVHLNFGDNPKPTGHVGSAITKKAETVAKLTRTDGHNPFGTVEVTPEYTRNMPFPDFKFTLTDDGLPVQDNKADDFIDPTEIFENS